MLKKEVIRVESNTRLRERSEEREAKRGGRAELRTECNQCCEKTLSYGQKCFNNYLSSGDTSLSERRTVEGYIRYVGILFPREKQSEEVPRTG